MSALVICLYLFVVHVHKEACKPNNVTDHRQAMDEAVTAAVMQQAATDEQDPAAVSSDEQRPDDDHAASVDGDELPKEDL